MCSLFVLMSSVGMRRARGCVHATSRLSARPFHMRSNIPVPRRGLEPLAGSCSAEVQPGQENYHGGSLPSPCRQLLDAGAHFGHQTHRWNPKMKPYIFGDRNGVHIIDLSQTVPLFARALDFISSTVAAGGKVLFVGTKRQAQEPIAEAARRPASISSTTAGWAACSPTGRRSRARSSASRRSRSSLPATRTV
jgi:hypothetical protein